MRIIQILLLGSVLFTSLSCSTGKKKSPEPISFWELDHYEINGATDRKTGIEDQISRRFHYTRNTSGELVRYPTHVKRSGEKGPHLSGAFSIEARVAPQQYVSYWNPVFDQGISLPGDELSEKNRYPGLAGTRFGGTKLLRVVGEGPVFLNSLDKNWSDGDKSWSGRWHGYLEAPATAKIKFTAEADDGIRLEIGEHTLIDAWTNSKNPGGELLMEKGKLYPVVVEYYRDGGDSYLRLFWEWEETPRSIVPPSALLHTKEDIKRAKKERNYQTVLPDEQTRLSFGIGPKGRPGIKMNLNGEVKTFYSSVSIPLKTWSHLAVTFDGNKDLNFFVDGEKAGSFQVPAKLTAQKGGDLFIGKSHKEAGRKYSMKEFSGIIGSLRIFDEEMDQDMLRESWKEQMSRGNKPVETVHPFRHVEVYNEPGRYAGWPANGGLWEWGNEIAVAFEANWFKDQPDAMDGHAKDENRSNVDYIAHSTDGGETWTLKKHPILDPPDSLIKPFTGSMPFTHPGFAFKSMGSRFYYSLNQTETWKGPFRLNVDGMNLNLSARTDYLVENDTTAFFFLSADPKNAEDRAFCAYTNNGGKTIEFRGWMTDPSPEPFERWVMPSTIRLSETHFVSAMRRKINIRRENKSDSTLNWIDVYHSTDKGKTWQWLSKVASTGEPNNPFNGNPPAMIKLHDGRLCVSYAVRNQPGRISARISKNNGKTWGEEIILRQNARNWDIGYPRSMQRPDGQVITIYYFATPENRNQFIAATIWDPDVTFARKK